MRIHFANTGRPRTVAKQVRLGLDLLRGPALPRVTLGLAREATARMFGYRDWHELDRCVGTNPPDPFDEDFTPEVVESRRAYQARALADRGFPPVECRSLVDTLTPSGRRLGKARTFAARLLAVSTSSVPIESIDLGTIRVEDMQGMFGTMDVRRMTFHPDPPPLAWHRQKLRLREQDFIQVGKPGPARSPN